MSKFNINNKIFTEGIKLEDLTKQVKKEKDKKMIESIFNQYNTNSDDVLDANEQVSMFAALKNSDANNDNKISKKETTSKDTFDALKTFVKAFENLLKGNNKTSVVEQDASGAYNVGIDENSKSYDKDGNYLRTVDNIGRTIEDNSDPNYVYTYRYDAENTDKDALPECITRKNKSDNTETVAEKNERFAYGEFRYSDKDGNMYDEKFNPGLRILEPKEGFIIVSGHSEGEMVPEQIVIEDKSDPNDIKRTVYERNESGEYVDAQGNKYTYDSENYTLEPVTVSGAENPTVNPENPDTSQRPQRIHRKVRLPRDWSNRQAELGDTLGLNQCNNADEVLEKLLVHFKAINISAERKAELKNGLITYNPSMFNPDGSIHNEADFSLLDFPKLEATDDVDTDDNDADEAGTKPDTDDDTDESDA